MADLSLKHIDKIYENGIQAVFDFNLEIKDKEFIVFVGPSGCGKSTTLRMIAGLEDISGGELLIDGKLMNHVEPKDRDIAMVFQSYALYPHMTVYENMSFGLEIKKMPKDEINKRVKEAAEILEINDYLDRKPKELSGGQRQRVALGRAIVRNAKVFLMDEPLSNLDAKLRVQTRSEIIRLHERIGATTIYVTHDQTEAMTMASRIVVMKKGYIQQIGTPKEIYNNPANMFVASFVGAPATNFLSGILEKGRFICEGYHFDIPKAQYEKLAIYEGKELIMGIRPENIHRSGVLGDDFKNKDFDYQIEVSELLGHESILHGKIGNQKVLAKINETEAESLVANLKFSIDVDKMYFFDKDSENRLA
ncbi:MAG: ABC transporter ATP-binding protein [Filifactoraceae bacterium]